MKQGYKQTEIGVIPEDWDIGSLKDAFPKLSAGVSVNSDESIYSDYYVLKTSAVRDGKVNITESKPVVQSDYSRVKCPVKKGTIIISRMNTPAMVGECGFSAIDAPNTFLPDRLWQAEPSSAEYDFQWLNYLLNTEKYSTAIRATATGTSNSMKNIAKDRLLEITIPKPLRPEQQRIADALSDMDELIASLEKTIAKKEAIKQGAMQELLTGKRRLEGFNGEWKTAKLISCTERIIVGLATSVTQYYRDHGVTLFRNLNILPNRLDDSDILYLDPSFASQYSSKQIRENDVLTVHTGYVGTSCVVPQKYDGSLTFTTLITTTNSMILAPQYLVFHLNSVLGSKMIESLQAGGGRNNLNVSDFEQYELSFPKDIAEQIAISNVIAAVDKEIELLKLKQQKLLSCKQGMMQQLLTGTTRLI